MALGEAQVGGARHEPLSAGGWGSKAWRSRLGKAGVILGAVGAREGSGQARD